HPVIGIAFAPDGKRLASLGGDGFVVLWETGAWDRVRRLLSTTENESGAVAFSADAKYLAAAGDGHTILVWETATGRRCHRVEGHQGQVCSLACTHSGKLISGSTDGTALVWELSKLPPLAQAPAPKPGRTDLLG